jgi:hypothetical protein
VATKAGLLSDLEGRLHMYASGGIAMRRHVGMVGEAGPEAMIPLNDPRARRMLGGGDVVVNVNGNIPPDWIDIQVDRGARRFNRRLGERADLLAREGRT